MKENVKSAYKLLQLACIAAGLHCSNFTELPAAAITDSGKCYSINVTYRPELLVRT